MKYNKLLFISVILLSIFGLIMIYSSSTVWASFKYNNPYKYVINQGIFLVIGIILMICISKIDYHIYEKYSNKILLFCLFLLILVLIPGIGTLGAMAGNVVFNGYYTFAIGKAFHQMLEDYDINGKTVFEIAKILVHLFVPIPSLSDMKEIYRIMKDHLS